MAPQIRRATLADAGVLSRVGVDTFVETFGHLYPPEDLATFLADSHSALAYARWLSGNLSGQFLSLLDQEVSAQEIALHTMNRDLALRKATGSDPEDIARMEERLKNGDYADYGPKEETLARYRREVGPNLTIMTKRLPDAAFEARENYLKGAMDEDTFIKALQEAVK